MYLFNYCKDSIVSKARQLADSIGEGGINLFDNSGMQIAQRKTSDAQITTKDFVLDRWGVARSGIGALSCNQTSSVKPPVASSSLKVAVETTDAMATTTSHAEISQTVEARKLGHLRWGTSLAKKLALSFYVRASIAGNYAIAVEQDDSDQVYAKKYTINSADSWEQKFLLIDANTGSGITLDDGLGLTFNWVLDASSTKRGGLTNPQWLTDTTLSKIFPTDGPAFMNTSGATFFLTGCKLEVGDFHTPWEEPLFQDELERCQRFFTKSYDYETAVGSSVTKGAMYERNTGSSVSNRCVNVNFPVEMRGTPTMLVYSLTGSSGNASDCDTNYTHARNDSTTLTNAGTKGVSQFQGAANADIFGFHYTADAEF